MNGKLRTGTLSHSAINIGKDEVSRMRTSTFQGRIPSICVPWFDRFYDSVPGLASHSEG